MRTFIAIDLPENIREEIRKIQEKLPEFKGKLTEKENLHLTLKFLGEVDEEKIRLLKDKLKEIKFKKFEAEIDSLGVFSEKFVRIVWLHLTNCEKLQEKIDETLKDLFPREERFMSHITIARVKSCKDKKALIERLKQIRLDNFKFKVESFELMKSELAKEGARYEVLEKFELI